MILYGDPTDSGRFDFSPWGVDESYYTEFAWTDVSGTLAIYCTYDEACVALMKEKMATNLAIYETLPVAEVTAAAFAISEEAMRNDPRRGWYISTGDVVAYRNYLVELQAAWPAHVRQKNGL